MRIFSEEVTRSATPDRWISPVDLQRLYPRAPTMAFVGNGSGLIGSGMGADIDRHDVVVRFNSCVTAGFEADVGANLDLFVTNGIDARSASNLDERCDLRRLRAAVTIVHLESLSDELHAGRVALTHPARQVPALFLPATLSNLDYLIAARGVQHRRWTTGTYAIYLLCQIMRPSTVLLAGFDLFGRSHESGHYYEATAEPGQRTRTLHVHDPSAEATVWTFVLNRLGCPVVLSQDVRSGIPQAMTIPGVNVLPG